MQGIIHPSLVYFLAKKYNRLSIIKAVVIMEYITAKEAGEKWGITARMVNYHCTAGRIPGAVKKADLWLIPVDAEKPLDRRRKAPKKIMKRI
jgi:hypothetical protein